MINQTKAFLPTLTQQFGSTEINIKTADCTFAQSDLVAEGIKNYRISGSPLNDTPPQENETLKEWTKRSQKKPKSKPNNENELVQDYADRVFKPKQHLRQDAYAVIKILCEVFNGQTPPSEEDFSDTNTAELRCFLFDVLNILELPEEAQFFRPHEVLSGTSQSEAGGTQQA